MAPSADHGYIFDAAVQHPLGDDGGQVTHHIIVSTLQFCFKAGWHVSLGDHARCINGNERRSIFLADDECAVCKPCQCLGIKARRIAVERLASSVERQLQA